MAGGTKPTREQLAQSGYRLPAGWFPKAEDGAPTNKSMTPQTDTKDSLDDVDFASTAAKDAAREANLTAEAFKRRHKSSSYGFTKADVERIAETVGADDEDEGSSNGEPDASGTPPTGTQE